MRRQRWVLVTALGLAGLGMAGCVKQSEFDAFKTSVHASGEAVDAWIASAHAYLVWLHQNMATICPECAPPNPPPSPPPDGAW